MIGGEAQNYHSDSGRQGSGTVRRMLTIYD